MYRNIGHDFLCLTEEDCYNAVRHKIQRRDLPFNQTIRFSGFGDVLVYITPILVTQEYSMPDCHLYVLYFDTKDYIFTSLDDARAYIKKLRNLYVGDKVVIKGRRYGCPQSFGLISYIAEL